ncbi:MAG: T9SS type A sorting domain-containing protein [Saprospiraceae bacterium]|nr:T9SS type A sorting domain-containing protein [Saprospiraceae bacterium]
MIMLGNGKKQLKFKKACIIAFLMLTGIQLQSQCNIAPVSSSDYVLANCNGYQFQILMGSQLIFSGTCGDLVFTPPLTGSDVISSVKDFVNMDNFFIYPNPAFSELNIQHKNHQGVTAIQVFTIAGVQIYNALMEESTEVFRMDISSFPAGTYFVRLAGREGKIRTFRFIKINH